jgi:glycosyltransferase involved in cell wall biosynthesis
MPTLSRTQEVNDFLESLRNQSFTDFELIVVDQNNDKRLTPLIEQYSRWYKIVYLRNTQKGLSRNRNLGLPYASGDIIAFPDDDCEYQYDILQRVNKFFSTTSYDFLAFRQEDKLSGKSDFLKKQCDITYHNIFQTAISFCIFTKKRLLEEFAFDEQLGAGARFGSGEESDMIAFFLKNKAKGFYDGFYTVYHPIHNTSYNQKRALDYGEGFGALHKKLIFYYKQPYYLVRFVWMVLKNIGAIILSKEKAYYGNALKGKLTGFVLYAVCNQPQSKVS